MTATTSTESTYVPDPNEKMLDDDGKVWVRVMGDCAPGLESYPPAKQGILAIWDPAVLASPYRTLTTTIAREANDPSALSVVTEPELLEVHRLHVGQRAVIVEETSAHSFKLLKGQLVTIEAEISPDPGQSREWQVHPEGWISTVPVPDTYLRAVPEFKLGDRVMCLNDQRDWVACIVVSVTDSDHVIAFNLSQNSTVNRPALDFWKSPVDDPKLVYEVRQHAEKRRIDAEVEIALEEYKSRVGRVAMEYAEAHGWCTVVNEALDDLGVAPPPTPRWRMQVSLTYTIEGERSNGSRDEPDLSFVRDSIQLPRGMAESIALDSDWENVEIIDWEATALDIENVDQD